MNASGGDFFEFPTISTTLSQTCICGHTEKKPLSQRLHICPNCGLVMQRDLFSAYLGLWVTKFSKKLNLRKARDNYNTYKPILDKCLEDIKSLKSTNPEMIASTFGI